MRNLKKEILNHSLELFADRIGGELVRSWFENEFEQLTIQQVRDDNFMDAWYKEREQSIWNALTEIKRNLAVLLVK